MVSDLATLLWVEGKRARSTALYWLRVLSFDPDEGWLYQLYSSSFWSVWLLLMWFFVVEQVQLASLAIAPELLGLAPTVIPWVVLGLQLVALAAHLREPPLRLTMQELTYAAASPVPRGLLALTQLFRSTLPTTLILAIGSSLAALLLSWPANPTTFATAGWQAFLIAFPLVLLSMGLSWAIALLALHARFQRASWILWAAVPLAIVLALAAPEIMLWPGRVWLEAAGAALLPQTVAVIIATVLAALWLLFLAGNAVYLPLVAERSATYARLHRLGMLATLYARDTIERIRRQASLARRDRLWFRPRSRAVGYAALWEQGALVVLRAAPASLYRPITRGVALVSLPLFITGIGGGGAVQSWLIILLVLVFNRPGEMVSLFRQQVANPFTRQWIHHDNLALLAASSGCPALLLFAGSLVSLFLSGYATAPFVLVLPLAITALALCQALELVEGPGYFFKRVPYEYGVAIGGGLVVAVGLFSGSPWAAVVVLLALNMLFARLLRDSHLHPPP